MNLHLKQRAEAQDGKEREWRRGEEGIVFISLQQINGDNHLSDGDGLPSQSWP